MEENKENKSIREKITTFAEEWFVIIFMICGFAILAITAGMYYYNHSESVFSSKDIVESLGQVGDFLGGSLNPIFAFLSYCLLLITIKLQNKSLKNSQEELKLTREELSRSANAQEKQTESLKIQNFENTFFNMINLHNEIVNNISIEVKYDFKYSSLEHNKVSISYTKQPSIYTKKKAIDEIYLSLNNFIKISNSLRKTTKVYDLCHEVFQDILGHYFGNIYQILKFIHTSKNIDKQKYSSLFRAQFSSQELGLLFFHCSGSIGSIKFKLLIEEFNFFEHLNIQNDNFDFILSSEIYKISAFGKNQKSINQISTVKKKLEDNILNLETKENLTTLEKLYLARNHFYKNKHDLAIDILNPLKLHVTNNINNLNSESKILKEKNYLRYSSSSEEIENKLKNLNRDINQINILINDVLFEKNSFISSSQEQQ